MANHKSAEKRARQTIRRTARNSQAKSSLKTFEKRLILAIQKKSDDLGAALRDYSSQMMKAVKKGVLKKQTAGRKISRLASRASSSGPSAEKKPN